jgi:hypothetical protein
MCAVEQNEARVMPETKEYLVHNIMNVDEMESEELPMSPDIIAREQKKDTHLKEVMKKSDKFSERTVERSTVITYDNKIYIPISLRKRIVWWYHTYLQTPRYNTNGSYTKTKSNMAQPYKGCGSCSKELS